MAGLILAAALSVALANTEPSVADGNHEIAISQPHRLEEKIPQPIKKELPKEVQKEIKKEIKKVDTKKILDTKIVIKLTGLDPATVKTILSESQKTNVDPFLILGLLKTESSFNPQATSRKGAKGLGQMMTSTARWTAKRSGLSFTSRSLYNPTYNAKLTVSYFSYLMKAYKGNVHKALTAYNRGISGLKYYEQKKGTAVSTYSQKVLKNMKALQQRYNTLAVNK